MLEDMWVCEYVGGRYLVLACGVAIPEDKRTTRGMLMRALVLVAHGSRREATRDEIRALTLRVAQTLGDAYTDVSCAFLELVTPSIPVQLETLVGRGATEIVVLPYLLATGSHVASDIPASVHAFATAHPAVKVTLLPHIGQAAGMADMIAGHAGRAYPFSL